MSWEMLANFYGLSRVAGFAQCLLSSWPLGFWPAFGDGCLLTND